MSWHGQRFLRSQIFSPNEIRRMLDMRFVLSLMVTMLSQYFNRDEEIETYLRRYNDEFPDREAIRRRFFGVSSFIRDCRFEFSSRFWKKADFFTAFIELDYLLNVKNVRLILLGFERPLVYYTRRLIGCPRVRKTFLATSRDTLGRLYKRRTTALIELLVGQSFARSFRRPQPASGSEVTGDFPSTCVEHDDGSKSAFLQRRVGRTSD